MSPTPGRSTLMQSAPNQARSCVQVGPDCTWVKSRIFTPSSALPAWPQGFAEGRGRSPLAAAALAAGFVTFSVTTFLADFFATTLVFDVLAFLAIVIPLALFLAVMPAKAGIQSLASLGSRLRGDDSGVFRLSAHNYPPLYFFLLSALCGLRLPMRPDSLPAFRSITALISVGLPESMAS